jgi:hypothetical protein
MRPCYQKDCPAGILDSLGRSHISGKAAYRAFFAAGSRVCPELYVLHLQDQAIAM